MSALSWTRANGHVLRYELGPANGPLLVLIHEMGGTLESFDAVCASLSGRFQTLRYDVLGSGLSEKILGDTSVDELVDDLHGLLSNLQLEQPMALCGVAVGAAIAIRFASRYPQRVSQLVALSPACGVADEVRDATLQRAASLRQGGLQATIAALLDKTWPAPLRTDPAAFERFALRWASADANSFAAIFSMLARLQLEPDLPRLPARTLLVAGEYDGLRPPAEIDRLASFADHIEALHVASGHFMPVQSPRWVSHLLTGYLLDGESGADLYRRFTDQPEHLLGDSRHAA